MKTSWGQAGRTAWQSVRFGIENARGLPSLTPQPPPFYPQASRSAAYTHLIHKTSFTSSKPLPCRLCRKTQGCILRSLISKLCAKSCKPLQQGITVACPRLLRRTICLATNPALPAKKLASVRCLARIPPLGAKGTLIRLPRDRQVLLSRRLPLAEVSNDPQQPQDMIRWT